MFVVTFLFFINISGEELPVGSVQCDSNHRSKQLESVQ